MWCWAASGQMVMEFLGKNVAQCTEANNRFSRWDCCQNPTPGACVMGGWPEFQKYGFTYKTTSDAALSWPDVRAQLASRNNGCRGTPFAFSWHWQGGGGHMMVATGYTTNAAGENFVFVNNPWPPEVGNTQTLTYDTFVELPGDHTHWDDYYDIE
jgi:Papain-like cysteine protease AvrRpt2